MVKRYDPEEFKKTLKISFFTKLSKTIGYCLGVILGLATILVILIGFAALVKLSIIYLFGL